MKSTVQLDDNDADEIKTPPSDKDSIKATTLENVSLQVSSNLEALRQRFNTMDWSKIGTEKGYARRGKKIECAIYKGGAGVVVLSSDLKHVVIVESKRAGNFGFPKGSRDKGETWQETALRELHEESGISEQQIEFVGTNAHVYIDEINAKGNISTRYKVAIMSSEQKLICELHSRNANHDGEILSLTWTSIEAAVNKLMSRRALVLKEALELAML